MGAKENRIPFSDVKLTVKQVSSVHLNEIGQEALKFAFTGYLDERVGEIDASAGMRAIGESLGIPYRYDPSPARRFAGDKSLPRGGYYTLCQNDAGYDDGTLVRELRAYYNPRQAGILQIFDLTHPRDRGIFEADPRFEWVDPNNIVLLFLPVQHSPNPFTARFGEDLTPSVLVTLPLHIRSQHFSKVIDLRVPSVADWFARTISTAKFEVVWSQDKASSFSAFPLKSGVVSFREVLPEMLAQQLGGSGFSMVAGLWCRKHDVGALIFPSARTDSGVEIHEGKVLSHTGWDLVDYTKSDRTHLEVQIDLSGGWSNFIGIKREDSPRGDVQIAFNEVRIEHVDSGASRGSWHVVGLRRRHEAHWRVNQAVYALNTYSEVLDKEVIKDLTRWLADGVVGGYVEQVGGFAYLLTEALMGVRESRQQILDFAASSEREGATATAHQLRAAMRAAAASR